MDRLYLHLWDGAGGHAVENEGVVCGRVDAETGVGHLYTVTSVSASLPAASRREVRNSDQDLVEGAEAGRRQGTWRRGTATTPSATTHMSSPPPKPAREHVEEEGAEVPTAPPSALGRRGEPNLGRWHDGQRGI